MDLAIFTTIIVPAAAMTATKGPSLESIEFVKFSVATLLAP